MNAIAIARTLFYNKQYYQIQNRGIIMEQSRGEKLGTMPLPKLMVSLAIPTVIVQLINVL